MASRPLWHSLPGHHAGGGGRCSRRVRGAACLDSALGFSPHACTACLAPAASPAHARMLGYINKEPVFDAVGFTALHAPPDIRPAALHPLCILPSAWQDERMHAFWSPGSPSPSPSIHCEHCQPCSTHCSIHRLAPRRLLALGPHYVSPTHTPTSSYVCLHPGAPIGGPRPPCTVRPSIHPCIQPSPQFPPHPLTVHACMQVSKAQAASPRPPLACMFKEVAAFLAPPCIRPPFLRMHNCPRE